MPFMVLSRRLNLMPTGGRERIFSATNLKERFMRQFSQSSRLILLATLSLLFVLTGCSNKSSDAVLVPVSTVEAQQLVQGKKRLMGLAGTQNGAWVDCRSEADFRAGHIPGAIHLPYERVSRDHKLLSQYSVLIVYGNDYNDARANAMSKRLIELGHDARTLTGGMRAWKAEGNPVATP
jgi:phage shock protein E